MAPESSANRNHSRHPRPTSPVVSVVMPTWNGERFLRPAIDSVLNQTFRDFELIIVDDGSTDSTPRILAEYKDKDGRLLILTNERNLGIAGATNRGLAAARGEYVALQDHDDISLPHRFQTQVDFLTSHPEIALVASAVTRIDAHGAVFDTFVQPCDELELKWGLLWGCPIHNTSVMAKRSALVTVGGFDENPDFRYAEAYAPLSRIAMRYRMLNLPEPLVKWRRHWGATTKKHLAEQKRANEAISFVNLCSVADREGSERDREYDYQGLKAFSSSPPGEPLTLPARQIISGLKFLCGIQESFYSRHRFSRSAVALHRKRLNWTWGKHAIALALRARWDLRSRARMFVLGVGNLGSAAWATLWARGGEGNPTSANGVGDWGSGLFE